MTMILAAVSGALRIFRRVFIAVTLRGARAFAFVRRVSSIVAAISFSLLILLEEEKECDKCDAYHVVISSPVWTPVSPNGFG